MDAEFEKQGFPGWEAQTVVSVGEGACVRAGGLVNEGASCAQSWGGTTLAQDAEL